jgi:hypothetical protein
VIKTSPQSITTITKTITNLIGNGRAGGHGLDMVGAELHGLIQDMGLDIGLIPFDIDLFPIG